jgi:GAF domain-containing protein
MKSPFALLNWSLRGKVIIFSVIAILAVLVIGVVNLLRFNSGAQNVMTVLVKTLAVERADKVEIAFTEVTSTLRQMTTQPDIIADFSGLSTNVDDPTYRALVEQSMQSLTRNRPEISRLRFISTDGVVLASTPTLVLSNASQESWFGKLSNITTLREVYIDQLSTNDTIEFVDLVLLNGKKIGYLAATVNPFTTIYKSMSDAAVTQGTILFYLVESDDTLESPFNAPVKSTGERRDVAATLEFSTNVDPFFYDSPVTGVRSLGLAVPLIATNRVLVAETRFVTAADLNLTGTVTLQMLLLITGLCLVLIIAAVIFDTIVVRPVHRLQKMLTQVLETGGQIQMEDVRPDDEIGDLYQSYDQLVTRIARDDQTLHTQIETRTQGYALALDITHILLDSPNVTTLTAQATEIVGHRFPQVQHTQVYLLNSTGQVAVLMAATGSTGAALIQRELRFPINDKSPVGRVIQTRSIVFLRERELDSEAAEATALSELRKALPEMQSELALPIATDDGVLGAIVLYSTRPDAMNDQDIRLLGDAAGALAQAIRITRRYEEITRRLKDVESLNQRTLAETWQRYGATRQRGAQPIDPWSDLQREAIEQNQLVEREHGETVTLAVPVSLRGQPLGVVEWDLPRNIYTDDTRQLAVELAARLAVSADNARLFEQADRLAQRERLVNDISSKMIQQTDVAEILQIAVQEVGKALRVPQTAIRLASTTDSQE